VSGMREPGPRSKEIVERERRHAAAGGQGFAIYAGLAMARGQGCTLVDEDGQEYIDFIAGVAIGSVGHCHPHYVETLKKQVEKLTFGSFTTETRARFPGSAPRGTRRWRRPPPRGRARSSATR